MSTDRLFTGQRLDDTGLYYYGARYYDPTIGRFISADTFIQDYTNPQSLNRYTYAFNNPLIYTDPTGNFGLKDIKKAAITVVTKVDNGLNVAVTKTVETYQTVKQTATQTVVNTTVKAGADTLVFVAGGEAQHTATVSFVANTGASSDATLVASHLPAQKVIQVRPNSLIGLLVNKVLQTDAITLNGTVVTTRDVTQPNQLGGYDPWTALHEEGHVVQQAQDPYFYYNYFTLGGRNYNDPSSYEGQANTFAQKTIGQITPVFTYPAVIPAWQYPGWQLYPGMY
jgi:RHS repeat-associated protein